MIQFDLGFLCYKGTLRIGDLVACGPEAEDVLSQKLRMFFLGLSGKTMWQTLRNPEISQKIWRASYHILEVREPLVSHIKKIHSKIVWPFLVGKSMFHFLVAVVCC